MAITSFLFYKFAVLRGERFYPPLEEKYHVVSVVLNMRVAAVAQDSTMFCQAVFSAGARDESADYARAILMAFPVLRVGVHTFQLLPEFNS